MTAALPMMYRYACMRCGMVCAIDKSTCDIATKLITPLVHWFVYFAFMMHL